MTENVDILMISEGQRIVGVDLKNEKIHTYVSLR